MAPIFLTVRSPSTVRHTLRATVLGWHLTGKDWYCTDSTVRSFVLSLPDVILLYDVVPIPIRYGVGPALRLRFS
jgi:hypothetical protein